VTPTLVLVALMAHAGERGSEPVVLLLPTLRGGLLAKDTALRIDRQLFEALASDATVRAVPVDVAHECVAFVAELGGDADACRADVECLAKTAIACGAGSVIAPRADWHLEGAELELVLVDAERAVVTHRAVELSRSTAGDADPAVPRALRRLLAALTGVVEGDAPVVPPPMAVSAPMVPTLSRAPPPAPAVHDPVSAAPSSSWALATAGGVVALVGAGGVAYGASTWFSRQADVDELARAETRFKDGTAIGFDLRDARASQDSFARTDASFAVGLVVGALGVGAAVAGAGALAWALATPGETP
jgi:hypothetical protein